MSKFLVALVAVAFAASESQACGGRAARREARTVTKTKTVARTGVLPPVRAVLVAPLRLAIPCATCR